MIPYLTIALAVCSLFATAYMNFVRPARRRRRAAMEITPPEPRPNFAPNKPTGMTAPDGRVPRDLDRPYPRPKGGRRKLDKTCPVCGTGAETTPLDGKVLGWRAHGSCAEWLGEWQPTGRLPVPLPYSPDKSLIGYTEKGQKPSDPGPIQVGPVLRRETGSTNTIYGNTIYTGGTVATIGWTGGAGADSSLDSMALTNAALQQQIANGHMTAAEAREWLDREVINAFGVPGPDLGESSTFTREACPDCGMEFTGFYPDLAVSLAAHAESGQCEQRRRKQVPAAIDEYCTCGMKFCGTPARIRVMLDEHRASGACPHSVKGRAADHPKPNFAPNRPTGPTAPDTRP